MRSAVDASQLAVMPSTDSLEVTDSITLLLSPDLLHVLVSTHVAEKKQKNKINLLKKL